MGEDGAGPGRPQGECPPRCLRVGLLPSLFLPWSVSPVLNHLTAFGLDRTITVD